jgi:hypothetical protein
VRVNSAGEQGKSLLPPYIHRLALGPGFECWLVSRPDGYVKLEPANEYHRLQGDPEKSHMLRVFTADGTVFHDFKVIPEFPYTL